MRTTTSLPLVLLALACTSRPLAHDDEAATTTAIGESGESSDDAATASTSETSGTSDTTVEGPFICEFPNLGSECDMFAQDCPEGEKCVHHSSDGEPSFDTTKCVPILGEQAPGEPCVYDGFATSTDDCDATSFCFEAVEVEGQLVGTCRSFCMGTHDDPICPPDTTCPIIGDGSINLCIPNCNPLAPDCNAGLGCYWYGYGLICLLTNDPIPTGEPCGFVNDCTPGNLCADAAALPSCAGSACCTQYCDLQLGDAGCVAQPGTVCVPFFEQGTAPAGLENVGVCIVPE